VASSEDVNGTEKIWLWGLDNQLEDRRKVYEDLLNDSMKNSATRTIHETLLLRYVSEVVYSQGTNNAMRLGLIRRICNAYLPTATVWECVFALERARDDLADKSLLRAVYEYWRVVDGISATSAWAGWLVDHGDGKGATQVISSAMVQLGTEDKIRFTEVWNSRLTRNEAKDEDSDASVEDLPLQLETTESISL